MIILWCGVSKLLQTDTASVLLESIGYIGFLQSQIEVMNSDGTLLKVHMIFTFSFCF